MSEASVAIDVCDRDMVRIEAAGDGQQRRRSRRARLLRTRSPMFADRLSRRRHRAECQRRRPLARTAMSKLGRARNCELGKVPLAVLGPWVRAPTLEVPAERDEVAASVVVGVAQRQFIRRTRHAALLPRAGSGRGPAGVCSRMAISCPCCGWRRCPCGSSPFISAMLQCSWGSEPMSKVACGANGAGPCRSNTSSVRPMRRQFLQDRWRRGGCCRGRRASQSADCDPRHFIEQRLLIQLLRPLAAAATQPGASAEPEDRGGDADPLAGKAESRQIMTLFLRPGYAGLTS